MSNVSRHIERGSRSRARVLFSLAGLAGGAGLAIVAAGGLGGCDSRTPTAKAVEEASRQLSVLTTSGTAGPVRDSETKQYTDVGKTLKDVLDKGLPQEQAAAQVLSANAKMGLAEHAAEDAATAERDSLNRATVIRGMLSSWISQSGQAAATEGHDPSAVIQDFESQATARGEQAQTTAALQQKLDAQVAELRAQAKGKQDSAQAEESQYGTLKTQASTVSATQAEGLIRQAAEHKRASDHLRHEAAVFSAKADQLAPQANEAKLQVEQFTNQQKTLKTMAQQLREQHEQAKKEAAGARSDAERIAVSIDKALEELRKQRTEVLTPNFDLAVSGFREASGMARKATGDDNGASKLTLAAATQSMGDLNLSRAHGHRSYIELLKSLAAATPALPNRAKFTAEAAEVEKARQESIEAAKASYEEARAAYGSAKATGEVREKLQNLSTLLEKMPDLIDGKIPNLKAAMSAIPKPEGEAPAPIAEKPADAGAPAGDLNATVDAFLAAAAENRAADLVKMMYLPPGKEVLSGALVQVAEAQTKLMEAVKTKFNTDPAAMMQGMGGMMSGLGGTTGGASAFKGLKAADLDIKTEGDTASVTIPGSPQPLTFKQVGGQWKLDAQFDKVPAAMADKLGTLLPKFAAAMDELAADVEAGKFNSVQAVGVGLLQKIQPLLGELQGGGGG